MKPKIDIIKEIAICKAEYTETSISKHANEVLMFMLRKYQFYAEIIMQAKIKALIDLPSTAAMSVDKVNAVFMFGPLFMTKHYTFANRMADAIHEVEHFMRMHANRGKSKQKHIWNIACDMVINQLIVDMAPEPWSVFPKTYKLEDGKTEEQYYNLLLQVQKEQKKEGGSDGQSKSTDNGGNSNQDEDSKGTKGEAQQQPKGDVKDSQSDEQSSQGQAQQTGVQPGNGTPQTEGSPERATDSKGRPWIPEEDIHPQWVESNESASGTMQQAVAADMVNRAIKACKGRGTLPSHIEELAAWLNEPPKINWKQELKQIVGNALKGAYAQTWARFNRRGMKLVRGKHRKHGKKVVVALDTSGSMASKVLNEMINELRYMRKLKEADIWMVMCDAEIAWKGKIERFSKLPAKFYGRGGTAFEPVFKWVEKENIHPDVLIYLTDGGGSYPKSEPNEYVTIWLMTDGCTPDVDWGRVINYPNNVEEL